MLPFQMIDETCNFLYHQSTYIWDRIGFSRRRDLRISETTITEGLIFDLWQFAERAKLGIEIYEAVSEKTNGNDVEIFVELNAEYIGLPCQAKIMDRKGKYAKIGHTVGTDLQIDLLIDYAKNEGAIPGYLLYNNEANRKSLATLKLHRPYELSHWGVSWAPAIAIEQTYFHKSRSGRKRVRAVPDFKALHPAIGQPFADLVCQMLHFPEPWKAEMLDYGKRNGYTVNMKTARDIRREDTWSPLTETGQIGFITGLRSQPEKRNIDRNLPGFNPKYRVIISLERPQRAIYSIS
jgi:hypothetical protein